jgi:hypothetical protein
MKAPNPHAGKLYSSGLGYVAFAIVAGVAIAIFWLMTPMPAQAQFAPKQVLTAAQLNAALAAPTITGGTINGAPIGQTAAAPGTFSNLSALSSATLSPSANVVISPSGSVTVNPALAGTLDNVAIGGISTPLAARFSTLTVTQGGVTGSIGGANLAAGACASGTVSISPAISTSMAVMAAPTTYPGDAIFWKGYVTATNVVTVKVCAAISATPTASTYQVRVVQ